MNCCRCSCKLNGKNRSRRDPEFCAACVRIIDDPMSRVRAAGAMLATMPNCQRQRQMGVFAFLSIFHPKMPAARMHDLTRSVQ